MIERMFSMPRFIAWFLVVIVSLPLLFVAVVFAQHIFLSLATVRHNDDFAEDTNSAIISLVDRTLRAYYGRYNRSAASHMLSHELIQRIDSERKFSHFVERRRLFWLADRNYMQSLHYIAVNDRGEKLLLVLVRVEEGILFNMRDRIHQITIKRNVDGTYVIVDIGYDT